MALLNVHLSETNLLCRSICNNPTLTRGHPGISNIWDNLMQTIQVSKGIMSSTIWEECWTLVVWIARIILKKKTLGSMSHIGKMYQLVSYPRRIRSCQDHTQCPFNIVYIPRLIASKVITWVRMFHNISIQQKRTSHSSERLKTV